jgi:hypothetical protein
MGVSPMLAVPKRRKYTCIETSSYLRVSGTGGTHVLRVNVQTDHN